jgi:nucleotide-binding universal stress UspA family protein
MFETILLAVDGSGHARKAVDYGIDIAAKYGAKLLILTVHPPGPLPAPLAGYAAREDLSTCEVYQRIVDDLAAEAGQHGVRDVVPLIEQGDAATAILAAAEHHGAQLIVLGSRGMGDLKGLLLGSVSHNVSHLANRPCLIVH